MGSYLCKPGDSWPESSTYSKQPIVAVRKDASKKVLSLFHMVFEPSTNANECCFDCSCITVVQHFLFVFASLLVSHLRSMGLNGLGYQPHLLQRCYSACSHEGSFHLSPVLALLYFVAMLVQHSYISSTNGFFFITRVLTLSVTEKKKTQTMIFTTIELTVFALADVRGYLLDHSGDEGQITNDIPQFFIEICTMLYYVPACTRTTSHEQWTTQYSMPFTEANRDEPWPA